MSKRMNGDCVIKMPLYDGSEYLIYEKDVREWTAHYPTINVMQELQRMRSLMIRYPSQCKTKSGLKRFMYSWFLKAHDDCVRRNEYPVAGLKDHQKLKRFFDTVENLSVIFGAHNVTTPLAIQINEAQKRQIQIKEDLNMEKFYVVRTHSAGVFAGNIKARDGDTITMSNAIRLWRWEGANTLSEIAMEGVQKPDACKFSVPVDEIILFNVKEIITATTKAEDSIKAVKVSKWWK